MFETVVFFDWFGTLSTSLFWERIIYARRHALRTRLRERLHEFFTHERETISLWMRGMLSDAEVVEHLEVPLPRNYSADYLERALQRDCRAATVRPGLAELVRELRNRSLVAVATDNMACFLAAVPTILDEDAPVDAVLSSAERQVLKAEDPRLFFAPMLNASGLTFSQTVLIDDCTRTCDAFRALGGRAYLYTGVPKLLSDLQGDPSPAVSDAARHAARAIEGQLRQLTLFADPTR